MLLRLLGLARFQLGVQIGGFRVGCRGLLVKAGKWAALSGRQIATVAGLVRLKRLTIGLKPVLGCIEQMIVRFSGANGG